MSLKIFKLLSAMILICLCFYANPSKAGDSELDLLRVEGVYEIETTYTHLDGVDKSKLDRLIIFRNQNTKDFTIALAINKVDAPFIVFNNTSYVCEDGKIKLRGEGDLENGIYGEVILKFSRESMDVEGVMTDSIATGYKKFTGKALYNLDKCLFTQANTHFPNISELVGEYVDEDGNLLLVRIYTSGLISVVMKKILSNGEYQDIKFAKGTYSQKYGLIELPWRSPFMEGYSLVGKANVTYRIDEAGVPYLKYFSLSTSGTTQAKARKFYFRRKIIDLPELR